MMNKMLDNMMGGNNQNDMRDTRDAQPRGFGRGGPGAFGGGGGGNRGGFKCFVCGQPGHMAVACPYNQQQAAAPAQTAPPQVQAPPPPAQAQQTAAAAAQMQEVLDELKSLRTNVTDLKREKQAAVALELTKQEARKRQEALQAKAADLALDEAVKLANEQRLKMSASIS